MRAITEFFYRFRGYLADPRDNGPALLVSVAILLAVACIIIVFALWIHSRSFARKRYIVVETAEPSPFSEAPVAVTESLQPLPWRLIAWTAFIALLLLWIAASTVPRYTMGKKSYCGSCHSMNEAVKSWEGSDHAEVPCQSCHESPGLVGIIAGQAQGLSNISLSAFYWGRHRPIYLKTRVSPGCLSCHEDIVTKIVIMNDTVRVSHREFVDSTGCESCHRGTGHTGKTLNVRLMDKCVTCHAETKASTDCAVCHIAEPAWSNAHLAKYTKARITHRFSCTACHETEMRCAQCHKAPVARPEDE